MPKQVPELLRDIFQYQPAEVIPKLCDYSAEERRILFHELLQNLSKLSDSALYKEKETSPEAFELWRRATAPQRNAERAAATLLAAFVRLEELGLDHYVSPETVNAAEKVGTHSVVGRAALLLVLLVDYIGDGGEKGLGGSSCRSAREGAFSFLGSGRRQATDGLAWRTAVQRILNWLGGIVYFEDSTLGGFNLQLRLDPLWEATDNIVGIPETPAFTALIGRIVLESVGLEWDKEAYPEGCVFRFMATSTKAAAAFTNCKVLSDKDREFNQRITDEW